MEPHNLNGPDDQLALDGDGVRPEPVHGANGHHAADVDTDPAAATAPPPPPGDGPDAHAPPPDDPNLRALIDRNFLSYASYVIRDRAIPALEDGLKPVQRRILHSLHENDDGKFIKVANIVGYTMQFHPHGDASIGDALVALAQKRYLIEGQGNFGNLFTGDPAAAPRYIECRLTELARRELFNPKLTRTIPSYDGRNREPVTLPAKLPVALMLGAEGIAVGLSTRILPHNFGELLEAQIAILQDRPFTLLPDFQQGGTMDASGYERGFGKIKVRAVIEPKPHTPGSLIIREIPPGTTTESIQASIEEAVRKKKLKVRSVDDFTAERVEIEVKLAPGENVKKAIAALYHFTECEQSLSVRPIVIRGDRPVEMGVDDILRENARQLSETLRLELEMRRGELAENIHNRTLAQIFIEERIYKAIEKCETYAAVQAATLRGVNKFRNQLHRDVTPEDVEKLLALPIKRISLFDLQQNQRDIAKMLAELDETEDHLKHLKRYAVNYLKNLHKTYAKTYPRLTRITAFEETDAREHAIRNLPMAYDKVRGYLGHGVRGEGIEPAFLCSELDRVLTVQGDGAYKVMPPPDKLFVDRDLMHYSIHDRERVYTVAYHAGGTLYVKRFNFGGAVMNKDYRCVPEKAKIALFTAEPLDKLYIKYRPHRVTSASPRTRRGGLRPAPPDEQTIDLAAVPVQNPKTLGQSLSHRQVEFVRTVRPRGWPDKEGAAPMGPLFG